MVVLVGYLYDQLFLARAQSPKLSLEILSVMPFGKYEVQDYPIGNTTGLLPADLEP